MLLCGIEDVVTGREHNVECSDGIKCLIKFCCRAWKAVTCTLCSRLTPVKDLVYRGCKYVH